MESILNLRRLNFKVANGSTQSSVNFQNSATIGSWLHLVGVLSNTNQSAYVNGVLIGSIARTVSPQSLPTHPLRLGLMSGQGFFNGLNR